jgi:hypothetical protein
MQPHAPFKTAGSAEIISTVEEDARREPGAAGVVRFLLRFTEMWISMLLGMAVFRYVRRALANHGYTAFLEPMSVASEVGNGVFMIAPMMLWMRIRGCRWRDNLEMAVAMLLPWAAVLVLGRLGLSQKLPWFSARAAMFLGMLAIMLYRRDCYTGGYSVNRGHDAVELE